MSGRRCILIVDDDHEVGLSVERSLRFLLARTDCDYVVATEPLGAIDVVDQAAAGDRPLLMICDFNLRAKLDGLQLLHEARQIDPRAQLVLVSAYPPEELRSRPEFRVLDAFLPKPFSAAELREVIASFTHGVDAAPPEAP